LFIFPPLFPFFFRTEELAHARVVELQSLQEDVAALQQLAEEGLEVRRDRDELLQRVVSLERQCRGKLQKKIKTSTLYSTDYVQ